MEEKTLKNLQLNLILTFMIGILGFFLNSTFSKYMGMDNLGLMKLLSQIVSYLSLVDLGIGSASTYALYKPLEEKNIPKLNTVLSTIDFFYKKIFVLILILGIAISFFLHLFINDNGAGVYTYIYWFLYVLNTAMGYLFAKYSILFIANQEYGYVRKIQGIGRIVFQIIQILILVKFQSFTLFIVLLMMENLYNYYFYKMHYKKYYNYLERVNMKDKNIIKDMKNLFWHKIGSLVVYNTDYIILAKYTSLSVIGVYSSYLMVHQIVMTIMNILTSVLTPKVGIFIVKKTKEDSYNYWKKLYSIYVLIATIFIICTYKLILPFIKLWMGLDFILDKLTVILILINLYIGLIRGVTDMFKDSYGFFDDIYTPALESVINLFFSIILVKKLGLNGVIIGTIISNIVVIFFLKPILVFGRCFDKKGIYYIKNMGGQMALSFISILVINKVLNNVIKISLVNINSWSEFIYKSIIMTLVVIFITSGIFLFNINFRGLINMGTFKN